MTISLLALAFSLGAIWNVWKTHQSRKRRPAAGGQVPFHPNCRCTVEVERDDNGVPWHPRLKEWMRSMTFKSEMARSMAMHKDLMKAVNERAEKQRVLEHKKAEQARINRNIEELIKMGYLGKEVKLSFMARRRKR